MKVATALRTVFLMLTRRHAANRRISFEDSTFPWGVVVTLVNGGSSTGRCLRSLTFTYNKSCSVDDSFTLSSPQGVSFLALSVVGRPVKTHFPFQIWKTNQRTQSHQNSCYPQSSRSSSSSSSSSFSSSLPPSLPLLSLLPSSPATVAGATAVAPLGRASLQDSQTQLGTHSNHRESQRTPRSAIQRQRHRIKSPPRPRFGYPTAGLVAYTGHNARPVCLPTGGISLRLTGCTVQDTRNARLSSRAVL